MLADERDNEQEDKGKPDGVVLDELPRSLRDNVELNNEYAGRETGRAHRFLTGNHSDGANAQERKKDKELRALLRLLQDPEYARLYYKAEQVLDRTSVAVGAALAKNAYEMNDVRRQIEKMRSAAPALKDGRKIFRAADGHVYAEDGTDVTAEAKTISWPPKGATWEEYKAEKDRLDALAGQRIEINDYRDGVLNPAKTRLKDEDNPPDKSELNEILRKVGKMPAGVHDELDSTAAPRIADTAAEKSAAEEFAGSSGLNAPDLGADFKVAHDGIVEQPAPAPLASLTPKSTP